MSRGNNEEQFKFLISCIRHANNSKVDFSAVAKECGIVSKGAAAKRYERMMKAHGIATNTPPGRTTPTPSGSKRESNGYTKKRKLGQLGGDAENNAVDDDEGVVGVKDEFGNDGMGEVGIKGEHNPEIDLNDSELSPFTAASRLDYAGHAEGMSDFIGGGSLEQGHFGELDDDTQGYFEIENAAGHIQHAGAGSTAARGSCESILID